MWLLIFFWKIFDMVHDIHGNTLNLQAYQSVKMPRQAREEALNALRHFEDDGNRTEWEELTKTLQDIEHELFATRLCRDCVATFQVDYDFRAGDVWNFCARSEASPSAPRQFAMTYVSGVGYELSIPYVLTVPLSAVGSSRTADLDAPRKTYPLMVYMHSAGLAEVVRGDVAEKHTRMIIQEAPLAFACEEKKQGITDDWIGLAPICPPNLGALLYEFVAKHERKKKLYWFKTCDAGAYTAWDFNEAMPVREMEQLILELLLEVCETLPVDPQRIFIQGASCGGYAALRLAQLVPDLCAGVIPVAGYYPKMKGHSQRALIRDLGDTFLWPMHCEEDKLCQIASVHVGGLYELLGKKGVFVQWVDPQIAKGDQRPLNFHCAHRYILNDIPEFFRVLSEHSRPEMTNAPAYIYKRLRKLWGLPPEDLPEPANSEPELDYGPCCEHENEQVEVEEWICS